MALQKAPKKSSIITAAVIILALALGGSILLIRSRAATPSVAIDAEAGTASDGALVRPDSTASGQKSVIFQGASPNFISKITTSTTKYQLEKGNYGSLTNIASKGYTKMNLVQVADTATTASTKCNTPLLDARLTARTDTTCEPYVSGDDNWRQQGLTGIGNSGYADRSDILIVSWHYSTTKARITVLNKTTGKQAFVALVRPCTSASSGYCDLSSDDDCGNTHSDGVVWYKSKLFMADTNCIIVFDVNDVFKLTSGSLVLPVLHFWHRTTTSLDYATLGLDVSGSVPQLMTAEYIGPSGEACGGTHIARFTLDPTTETIKADSDDANMATSDATRITKKCLIQGIAYSHGMYYLSSLTDSGEKNDYTYRIRTVATAPPDATYTLPLITPEGLYIDEKSGTTWNLSEHGIPGESSLQARVYGWQTDSALQSY